MCRFVVIISFVVLQIFQASAYSRMRQCSPRTRKVTVYFSEEMRADLSLFIPLFAPLFATGVPFTVGYLLFTKDIDAVQKAANHKSDALQAAANHRSDTIQAAANHRADLISKDLNSVIDLFSRDLKTVTSDLAKISKDVEILLKK
jgi:hypothetical protein